MRRGLTLMETVLAVWITFVVAVTAYAILQRVMQATQADEHRLRAAFLAQGKLEELMALPPRRLRACAGVFDERFPGYRWRATLQPIDETLQRVVVTVHAPRDTSFRLTTVRQRAPRRLWFASNRDGRTSQLYRIQEDGEYLERMTHGPFNNSQPAVAPDGESVVFVSDRSGTPQLYRMGAEPDAPATLLVEMAGGAQAPTWSADGKYVAFVAYDRGYAQIVVYDMVSGEKRNWTKTARHDGAPAFTPEGDIWCSGAEGQGMAVYRLTSDGHRTVVTQSSGWNTAPAAGSSGEMWFMSNRDGNPELYCLESERLRRVTSDVAYDTAPRVSPDGQRVVFVSDRSGVPELYVMDGDGQGVRRVVPKPAARHRPYFEHDPSWEP